MSTIKWKTKSIEGRIVSISEKTRELELTLFDGTIVSVYADIGDFEIDSVGKYTIVNVGKLSENEWRELHVCSSCRKLIPAVLNGEEV